MNRQSITVSLLAVVLLLISGCNRDKTADPSTDLLNARALSESAYNPATATARVFGTIRLVGKIEEIQPPRVGGSRYCVMNKRFVTPQDVLITDDGKLRNVMVYVRSGHEGHSYLAPGEPVLLDQQHCLYVPHVLTIMTNQKLLVRNSDETFHNVHAIPTSNPVVNLAQPEVRMENTVSFSHPEVAVRIGCDLHGWMGAWVGVFDHPFHTTSGETGTYELRLPPGKYQVAAWHEKYGELLMSVDLDGSAERQLDFDFVVPDTK